MGYAFGLVVVGLFFLALHYFTELDTKQKSIITAVVLAIILSAVAFNTYSASEQEKMLGVVTKFNQHKSVTCNGLKVDDKNFTLSVGTYTFIGKKDTPSYGLMISASNCE